MLRRRSTMTVFMILILALCFVQNLDAFQVHTSNRQQLTFISSNAMIMMTANFDEPVTIGASQRGMVRRGLMAAASAVAGSAFLSSSSSSILRPVLADESQPLGLCSSCGLGVPGSLTSLCSRCSKGDAWYNPANERIFDTARGSFLPPKPELYLSKDRLGGSKIITIGEVHSNPCHHKLEFDIIRTLGDRNEGKIAIGLECFYRQHQVDTIPNNYSPENADNLTPAISPSNPYQAPLDRFIFEHKDFATLKRETNWDQNWGYDLNYYAKIFNFAATRNIRLVGLNVPYPVAQLVGRVGLDNLPSQLRRLLPPVDLSVQKHRKQFEEAILTSLGPHGGHGQDMNKESPAFARMYQVQTLWDEYMAESAVMHARKNPLDTLVVIAGVGHVTGRVGIPDRIHRRMGGGFDGRNAPFVIVPQQVDWNTESGLPEVTTPLSAADCDWAWYTEKEIESTGTA